MKNNLCALLMTVSVGGLFGQARPVELAEMEFLLLGKHTNYSRVEFTDSGSVSVDEILDIQWDASHNLVHASDSFVGIHAFQWNGVVSGNSNTITITAGTFTLAKDIIYWDAQMRDTLVESYLDTNNDGTLDRLQGLRFFYGTSGIDSASYVIYSQSGSEDILTFIVHRDGTGKVDSITAHFNFFGFRVHSFTYDYMYSGNMLFRIDTKDYFDPGSAPTKMQLQNNVAEEITGIYYLTWDSVSASWINDGSIDLYPKGTVIGQGELTAHNFLEFYPNPVKEFLDLKSDRSAIVDILSLDGRVIYSSDVSDAVTRAYMGDLPRGTYILKFRTENLEKSYKIVKE